MPNYKEIARLKSAGQSNRAIADALGISRNTVNVAVSRIEESGLCLTVHTRIWLITMEP